MLKILVKKIKGDQNILVMFQDNIGANNYASIKHSLPPPDQTLTKIDD